MFRKIEIFPGYSSWFLINIHRVAIDPIVVASIAA